MDEYCDNEHCEFPAVTSVPVWDGSQESCRWLCATCLEAYTIGVQYGKYVARKDPAGRAPGNPVSQ